MSPMQSKKTVWIVLLLISNLGVASSSMIDFLYVIPGHRETLPAPGPSGLKVLSAQCSVPTNYSEEAPRLQEEKSLDGKETSK